MTDPEDRTAAIAALKPLSEECVIATAGSVLPPICVGPLTVDFTYQRINKSSFTELLTFADRCQLTDERDKMLRGEAINGTELRAVLHSALRYQSTSKIPERAAPPLPVQQFVSKGLAQLEEFVSAIHSGHRRSFSGKRFTDVVNIGIGGSHLGLELVIAALTPKAGPRLRTHFLSNVDGHTIAQTLLGLDPERTLFIVTSKSFSTLETGQTLMRQEAGSWSEPRR